MTPVLIHSLVPIVNTLDQILDDYLEGSIGALCIKQLPCMVYFLFFLQWYVTI